MRNVVLLFLVFVEKNREKFLLLFEMNNFSRF